MNIDKERLDYILRIKEQINGMEGKKMKDIRYREWLNYNTKISQALMLIINAENILGEFDDFSLENGQCYPEMEDFYNQLANIRADLMKYVDENPDILNVNTININK